MQALPDRNINDQLKNISQIEHSRHRSLTGFIVKLVAGLIAYTYQRNPFEVSGNTCDAHGSLHGLAPPAGQAL